MKRSHWMTAFAVFALAASAPAAWAAPAAAEKTPLNWVPATAPLVAHLNSLDTLRDHVGAFLKNAVPDRADMLLEQYDSLMKNGVQGRKLRGLSKDGPLFFVLTDLSGGPDSIALVAAVSDYAAFRDNILTAAEKGSLKSADGYESTQLGPLTVYFVDKKDYVVVTPGKDLAATYAKRGSGAEGAAGLDGKMSKAQAARFLASDVGYYIDMEAVNDKFGEQIKAARKAVDEQLDKAAQTVGKEQKGQIEMAKKMVEPVFQAVEDAKAGLVTLDVRADGVALHLDGEARSGTSTADLLKGFSTSSFPDLGKLPAGEVFYAGMKLDPALLKAMTSLMSGLSDSPNGKAAAEAFEEVAKAGPTESISAVTYPVAGLNVTKCNDPEKEVAASIKMLQSMGAGGLGNVAFKEKPEVKENAEKYNKISFTSVHMAFDFDKMLAGAGTGPTLPEASRKQLVEGLKKLVGEEVNSWIGADGKSVVQVTAKDWESAQKTLDQYYKGTGGVGDDKGFASARKQLPEQSTFIVLIDAVQAVGDVMDFVKPILQASGATLPPNFPTAVKGKPGFVGFALTLDPDHGAFDVVVTADAVKQIYQGYVSPLLPKQ